MRGFFTFRIISAWTLLFIYLSGGLTIIHPYIEYQFRSDYISKVLCINKAKPEMHCQGKCYFTRKLQKAAEKESEKKEISVKFNAELIPAEALLLTFSNLYNSGSRKIYPSFSQHILSPVTITSTPPPKA